MKRGIKIVLWTAAAVLLLTAVMSVTFVLLVQHNPRFRQYLLAKVQDSIYESTRARVETRDFHVNSSTMTVVMDQVVVHGTEPATARPLLRVDRLEIGLAIDSLLGGRWHLREMAIVHPVVHVIVDRAGNNNLPKPPGQTGGGNSELFNLGVRRLALQRGEIYYNDRQSRLEADLQDLELSAYFQPTAREYQGQIGYAQGRIVYAAHAPIAHSLQADFNLSPKKFTVDHLQVIAGKSSFTGNATMENYADSNPSLKANYDAVLATSELARILQGQEVPVGTVRLTGFLSYQNPDHRPLLQAVSVWGMMSSPELAVRDAKLQTTARNVAAKFKLENGTAEVQNLRAQIFGGTLEGRAVIRDVAGAGAGRLEVLLKNVSLSVLQTASANNPMREAHLTGTVNADVQATWGKSLKTLAGRANLTIQASLGENPTTPLEGVIHADYSQAARAVALHNSYLRTPQNSLTLDGAISRFSHLQFRLQARDLHEVELLVKGTSRLKSGPPHSDLGLYGSAQMQGTITGDLSNPQIRAQLAATNFRVKGSGWKSLRAAVSAGRSQIIVSQGELRGGTEGRITFSLESALNNWSYSPANPISAHISASRISLADLDRLANRDDPVAGTLALELHIKGTQRNPTGRGNLVLENATVAQEKVQSVEARFEGNGEVVNLGLHARMAAGKAEGSLIYYPKTQGYKGRLEASNLRIEKFSLIAARNAQVAGAMDVKVEGQGTLERPEIVASVSVPELRVQKQTIQGTNLQARLREGVAELSFDARVAQTSVKASGTVGVAAPYQTDLHLDTGTVPLHDLLALYAPGRADGFTGQTELHAYVRGPLADRSRLDIHMEAPVLTASYKEFHLAAVKSIHLDYRDGVAVLHPSSIQGTGTDIQMEATIPVKNPSAAKFLVRGTVDLRAAQLLQPGMQSSGRIEFDVDSRRYSSISGTKGVVRIIDAAVHAPAFSLGLDHGNGMLVVSSDRLLVNSFRGEVGGGTVTANGSVTYRSGIQSNLALDAKSVRVRYPQGLRTVLDANLRLTGSPADSVLNGQVLIDHISFTPDFDLGRFTAQFQEETVSNPSSFAQNMKLDLTLQSTSEVNLSSSQLSLQGRADLRIAGNAATPVLLGRANLSGGEMLVGGNRYVIENGTIDFVNPVRTQAVVNLRVKTEVDQYSIALNFTGPLQRLHVDYTSDPALPPADIINLLAFGKTTEAQAASSPGFSTAGAQALLAQGIGNVVGTGVAKFVGLPHVSIDPALRGSGQDPGARISVQQRVTSNLFVTYSTDVTQTQRPAISVDYRLNRRWSLRGTRDQNGGLGISGQYRKDF